jgi:hypothetical protein
MAARPTTPTTTPAAIPAVFGLLSDESLLFVGEAEAEATADVEVAAALDCLFDDEDSLGGS